jgi:stringent starvation protein B
MVHPVQSVIESLYAAGRCPRLHVNATHAAVVCPEEIRHQWKERLIIDLDSSYPLDLTFGQTGLAANLSFGGTVTRCTFPWEAIYVVMDRATGRGIVLDRHVPESVRRQSGAARAAVRPDPEPETESTPEPPRPARRRRRARARAGRQARGRPPPPSPPGDAEPAPAEKPATDESGQEAPRRVPRDRRRRLTAAAAPCASAVPSRP